VASNGSSYKSLSAPSGPAKEQPTSWKCLIIDKVRMRISMAIILLPQAGMEYLWLGIAGRYPELPRIILIDLGVYCWALKG
jgi:hypothetical protein